jgi:CheY-like chemotaxis protein
LGFEVRQAVNGLEAIKLWQEWQPHLIWMDMRLPVMDGHEATRRIKATPQGRKTIIVALTASVFKEEREKILAEGCDDFVRKPFREAEICDALVRHLGVRFVYEELEKDTEGQAEQPPDDLSAKLATLPSEWLNDLHQAALEGDWTWVATLIEQIRQSGGDKSMLMADKLSQLANKFEYGEISRLAQQASDKR